MCPTVRRIHEFDSQPRTSILKTSPGSHSAITSKGRQQTSQSVVNRWFAMLVSIAISKLWPQKGHWMDSVASTGIIIYKTSVFASPFLGFQGCSTLCCTL